MGKSRKLHNHDRLSELPDSLLIAIISFLEMKDAVRTSFLSKRWKDRWTTVPSLKFSCPRLGNLDTYCSFVNDALLRWKGTKILRFDLSFCDVIPHSRNLDSWLLFAIEKQVEELFLCLGLIQAVDSYYCPPQPLYSCSSIRKLTLSCVKLIIPENVQLSQLTSLTVYGSKLLSEQGMTRLLSGAPVIEELILLDMHTGEDYNIRSESLKKLHIGSFINGISLRSALRIWAPNLSTLTIGGFVSLKGGFRLHVHVPSLTAAGLLFEDPFHIRMSFKDVSLLGMFGRFFLGIRHARRLQLPYWCIKLLLQLKKKDMPVEFSNAQHLKVSNVNKAVDEMLLAVVEMCPKLVTLAIVYDTRKKDLGSFSSSENKIDIPLRHLKTCEISVNAADSSILRAVEAVLENGEMLEKMILRPHNGALDWGALEKVYSMRRSSPKARVIIS